MTTKKDGPGRADAEDDLDALVADALARRGDLLPTTEAEVLAAEKTGVAFEGELPPALRSLRAARSEGAASCEGAHRGESAAPPGAASHRVVAIDEIRRRREAKRSSWTTHAGTFALGAAAAAALLVTTREPGPPHPRHDPAGAPATSTAPVVPAPSTPPMVIPAVTACATGATGQATQQATECCAGASCAAAKGELRACASGRTCVSCAEGAAAAGAYRVRIGNLIPAAKLDPEALRALDVCARFGGSPWSCEPAWADAAARPAGRILPGIASVADLAAALELEVRPRGTRQVLGRWRDAVRIGPTVLCRGAGALVANEKQDLGSVPIDLVDTHWVEIARAASTGPLEQLRAGLDFADVVPSLVQTTAVPGGAAARFVLAAGPFDQATAERLRWELLHLGRDARVTLGADLDGAPQPLPARP